MARYPKILGLLYRQTTAWGMLLFALLLTTLAWWMADRAVTAKAQERFGFEAMNLAEAIQSRLQAYETILRGGVGFFEASNEVTREEWHRYVDSLRLARLFPGIQGLGFTLMMPAAGVEAHLAQVRAEGFPNYEIRPPGPRDPTSAILYLEPFDWRNQRAFGYDMFSEPVRRAAMTRAMETGEPALSGRVTLVQETDQAVQPGFLMYVPLYRPGLATTSPDERRAAIQGFVYAPFRAYDLMQGLGLGRGDQERLAFALYDGEPEPDALLFASAAVIAATVPAGQGPPLPTLIPLPLPHRLWHLFVSAPTGYLSLQERILPRLVAGVGLVIALALFFVIASLARQRHQVETDARELAGDLMENIRRQRLRLENIIEGTHVGTWEWNVQTGETIFNERWAEILGYSLDELRPISIETWSRFTHPDDLDVSGERLQRHFASESPYYECEARMRHRQGHWIWVLDRGKVATWTREGQPLWMYGTHQDITERKQAHERLAFMAHHDVLTSLPNRALLIVHVEQALGMAKRNRAKLALLFIDLDKFKPINDNWGHAVGDQVLQVVAARLRGHVRASDSVGRIGGDEFLVLLTEVASAQGAAKVAEGLRQAISQPMVVANMSLEIAASIGIALFPEHGQDSMALARHADQAMYLAKQGEMPT
jgi:diguanylate cyclase (GGDEF)-like protein/PAS domain S-box-containing protein